MTLSRYHRYLFGVDLSGVSINPFKKIFAPAWTVGEADSILSHT